MNYFKTNIFKKILIFALAFSLFACVDKDYDISNIETDITLDDFTFLGPIGTINANLGDLLKQFEIESIVIEGNRIYFEYKDSITIDPIHQVMIDDGNAGLPHLFAPATGTRFILDEQYRLNVYAFSLDVRLDSIRTKKSRMKLNVQSGLTSSAELTVEFPNSRVLSNPSPVKLIVHPGDNTFYIDVNEKSNFKVTKELLGYYFDIKYTLDTPSPIALTPTDIQIYSSFESLNSEIIFGYFPGLDEVNVQDRFDANLMGDFLTEGSVLYLSDALVTCDIKNYNGFESKFTFDYFKAINKDNSEISADFNGSPSYTETIDRSQSVGGFTKTSMHFDKNNGSTNRLFSSNLVALDCSFTFQYNSSVDNNQFISMDKNLDLLLDIRVPLSLDKGSMLLTKDTLDVQISGLDENESINLKDIVLRIVYTNNLPVRLQLEAVFLDADKKPIQAIAAKKYAIKSPTVNNHGVATAESTGSLNIGFNASELSSISKINYIQLATTTSGSDANTPISFSTSDFIRLKADIYVKGDININLKNE